MMRGKIPFGMLANNTGMYYNERVYQLPITAFF